MTNITGLVLTIANCPPPTPISADTPMTIEYIGGPSGDLTGGNSYAFQFKANDKDKWLQNGIYFFDCNLAHSAYIDFSAPYPILTTGSMTNTSSNLAEGEMNWEASGAIVNPWENGSPVRRQKFLTIIESDGNSNPTLDDSDCQIVKDWWVQGV